MRWVVTCEEDSTVGRDLLGGKAAALRDLGRARDVEPERSHGATRHRWVHERRDNRRTSANGNVIDGRVGHLSETLF
jgi:hypothetical protein